jgi:hypothetical protein
LTLGGHRRPSTAQQPRRLPGPSATTAPEIIDTSARNNTSFGIRWACIKHLLALGALAAFATTAHADDKKYTMADLKALIEQKGYQEAIEHMKDISPSERKADGSTSPAPRAPAS